MNILLPREDDHVNSRDHDRGTPFLFAAGYVSVEVSKLLMSHDYVAADARDVAQITPLHFVTAKHSAEIAKLFLSRDDVEANALEVN